MVTPFVVATPNEDALSAFGNGGALELGRGRLAFTFPYLSYSELKFDETS
jgi:hypothetical protein